MNRLRRFLILAVVLATVLFNGSGMTEQLEPVETLSIAIAILLIN